MSAPESNMRLDRIAKHYFQLIKSLYRIAVFLLKKCWLHSSLIFAVVLAVYLTLSSLLALLTATVGSIYITYKFCDWLLYHPNDPPDSRTNVLSPSIFKLPFESHFIKTADGVNIHCFFIAQPESRFCDAVNLIYLHGNAGNIGHRLQNASELYHQVGCNILLVEYRGFGLSRGSPNEAGLYLDAEAALNFLLHHPGVDRSKIFLFGRSLGGAVAIELATRHLHSRHIRGLILENTFTSVPDVARCIFNCKFIRRIPNSFYKNHFNSMMKVSHCTLPALFISGLSDELIPPQMMSSLYMSSASVNKHLHTFESGTHNFTWRCPNYYQIINLFVQQVLLMQTQDNHTPNATNQNHHQIQQQSDAGPRGDKLIEII